MTLLVRGGDRASGAVNFNRNLDQTSTIDIGENEPH